jgi:hypothetical protein
MAREADAQGMLLRVVVFEEENSIKKEARKERRTLHFFKWCESVSRYVDIAFYGPAIS